MSFIHNENIIIKSWNPTDPIYKLKGNPNKLYTSFDYHFLAHNLQPNEVFNGSDPKFSFTTKEDYYRSAKELAESDCIGLYEYICNPTYYENNNTIIGWIIQRDGFINNIKIKLLNNNSELVLFDNDGYIISYILLRKSRTKYDITSQDTKTNLSKSGLWLKEFYKEYIDINNSIINWYSHIENKINDILDINNSLITYYYTKGETQSFVDETTFRTNLVKETNKIKDFFHRINFTSQINSTINTNSVIDDITNTKSELLDKCKSLMKELSSLEFRELTRSIVYLLKDEIHYYKRKKESLDESLLLEKIEKHNTLNPILWDSNNELKQEIRETLEDIVDQFITDLKDNDIEIKVLDSVIVGSNASYNYTEDSDLDLHIIVDTNIIDCKYNLLKVVYDYAKSMFNNKYDLSIYDIPVEIYVEDLHTSVNSNGIYSLKGGWIKEPIPVDIPDNIDIDEIYPKWEERANELLDNDNTTFEDVEKYIDDIYLLRKQSIMKDGEYSNGNLVFKEIRNNGLLDMLKELKNELKSKELSLE